VGADACSLWGGGVGRVSPCSQLVVFVLPLIIPSIEIVQLAPGVSNVSGWFQTNTRIPLLIPDNESRDESSDEPDGSEVARTPAAVAHGSRCPSPSLGPLWWSTPPPLAPPPTAVVLLTENRLSPVPCKSWNARYLQERNKQNG